MNTSVNTVYSWGEYNISKLETGYRGGLEWAAFRGEKFLGSARSLRSAKSLVAVDAGLWTRESGFSPSYRDVKWKRSWLRMIPVEK